MKAKDVVTLVLLVVGIAIAYAAVKRSGLDRAFLGATSGGDIARGPNVRADVMTGPLTGSGPGGGPGSFGVTSSPIVNNVGVASGGPPAPFVGVTPNLVTLGGTIVGIGGGGFAGRPQDFFRAIAPGPATVGAAAPAAILSSSGLTADERASDIADRLGLG